MPVVAIDHDGTYTTDPVAWTKCIDVLKAAGFEVICISSRFPNVPLPPLPVPVYYACGESKWEFAHRHGLAVDIWIDDCPMQIGEHPDRRGEGWPQREQRNVIANQVIDNWRRQFNGQQASG
jgi:hypothetical protein